MSFFRSIFLDSAKSAEHNNTQPGSPTGSVESAQDAASELAGMTLEEQELQKAEWNQVRINDVSNIDHHQRRPCKCSYGNSS